MAPAGEKKNILKRLDAGEVVIGDGGFVFALEKRGYVKAGPWTPEAAAEHPEAVRQLHREFLRAGSNVMQTFTFYASDDKLENRGQTLSFTGRQINEAACDLAREVANEGDALVAGGVSQTPAYLSGKTEEEVKAIFIKQIDVFVQKNVDFLIAEWYGPDILNSMHAVCADIVGINCHFDPETCVKTVKLMKEGVEKAGLKAHYMSQPLAFHTPDCGCQGFIDLPEFPFGLEPRILTRMDMHKYAREAYNAGIRYIGGCCGFEPYHIRALAEELEAERGCLPAGSEKHGSWGSGLSLHTKPWVRARARRDYWEKLKPASGRPFCPSMSTPDSWGVTKGHADLMQQKEATSKEQLEALFDKASQGH
uniref:Betaine--homocysteine S-methyltransferase 1-like n=1 Tax=Pundamilia nyererei TaxID=303518 RepID=A0A3B4FDB8_9CICH